MIRWLWLELRRRGVIQGEYAVVGGSSGENYLGDGRGPLLRHDHPGVAFTWSGKRESDEDKNGGLAKKIC